MFGWRKLLADQQGAAMMTFGARQSLSVMLHNVSVSNAGRNARGAVRIIIGGGGGTDIGSCCRI